MATFAERLKKIRKGRKLTQSQLAETLGIAVSTLSRYENSKTIPNFSTISRYAAILKVTPEWLSGQAVPRKIKTLKSETQPVPLPEASCTPPADSSEKCTLEISSPLDSSEMLPSNKIHFSTGEVDPHVPKVEVDVLDFSPSVPELNVVDCSSGNTSSPSVVVESDTYLSIREKHPRLFKIALIVIIATFLVQFSSVMYLHQLRTKNVSLQAQTSSFRDEIDSKDAEISTLSSKLAAMELQISDYKVQLKETASVKYDAGYETGYSEGYDAGYEEGYVQGQSDGRATAKAEEVEFIQEQLSAQYESGYSSGHSDGYTEGYELGSSEGYDRGYSAGDSNGYSRGIDYATTSTNSTSSQSSSSQTGSWDNTSGTYVASSTGYPASTIVYVSSSGKIHLHSNCSGMKNYKTTTLGEAESHSSYSLCKNCF